jgi:hypothetical protein
MTDRSIAAEPTALWIEDFSGSSRRSALLTADATERRGRARPDVHRHAISRPRFLRSPRGYGDAAREGTRGSLVLTPRAAERPNQRHPCTATDRDRRRTVPARLSSTKLLLVPTKE